MTTRRFRVLASLTLAGAIAACVIDPLNPQPLPPGPDDQAAAADAGIFPPPFSSDAAATPDAGNQADTDAATTPPEAPADGGDAGDAGTADAADAG